LVHSGFSQSLPFSHASSLSTIPVSRPTRVAELTPPVAASDIISAQSRRCGLVGDRSRCRGGLRSDGGDGVGAELGPVRNLGMCAWPGRSNGLYRLLMRCVAFLSLVSSLQHDV
jgi:hypothetical protein